MAWLQADEYEAGRFSRLLARSMAPFSAERWERILRATKEFGVPATLIVDGLNECPESERGKLFEQLQACTLRYPSSVLITTTQEEHLPGWLEATVFRMNKPDESARLESPDLLMELNTQSVSATSSGPLMNSPLQPNVTGTSERMFQPPTWRVPTFEN